MTIDRTLYGNEHINIGFDLNEIAVVLRLRSKPDSAAVLLRHALAISRRISGERDTGTLAMIVNLGRALADGGHFAESEELLRGALAKLDTNNADEQPLIIPARVGLGRVLLATNRARDALPVIKSVVSMSLARLGAEHWRTGEAQLVLAECHLAMGDAADAEEPLRKASAVLPNLRKSHPSLAIEVGKVNAAFARATKPSSASTS